MSLRSVRIVLTGSVQGCGVRPSLARLAVQRNWAGSVINTTHGVELILSGSLPSDDELLAEVRSHLPTGARLDSMTSEAVSHLEKLGFSIDESNQTGWLAAPLPLDVAVCAECLREARDPADRRFRYALTSCATCGPRYSILFEMPFDRARTSLRDFPMCEECRDEYEDPHNRRFHAQTICCPNCGPSVWAVSSRGYRTSTGDEAVQHLADILRAGGIAAVRGVGGYQLLADATSSDAIQKLRRRKRRVAKPFAVLCRTVGVAAEIAELNEVERQQLTSPANPIVVVRQRDASELAGEVNPGLREIGLMLPTTVMHERIAELVGKPLVCTSGNLEGEPLASEVDEAEHRLAGVVDIFLHHNRPITNPIDDSVVRVIAGRASTFRCARGLAPMPLPLPKITLAESIVGLGGHQKSAASVATPHLAVLGPHVGELDSLAAQENWTSQLKRFLSKTGVSDDCRLAHDAHPGYFPTRWSEFLSNRRSSIWHHHAHIVTGMIEPAWLDRTVLGVAFDGTGLGPDHSIWGGEVLRVAITGFERVAHFRTFGLPGGDVATTDLRRLSVALLGQLEELSQSEIADLVRLTNNEVRLFAKVADSQLTPRSSSCGRLFDVAASLILGIDRSEYEGAAAMALESACHPDSTTGEYHFGLSQTSPIKIDWRPVLRAIISDRRCDTSSGVMAMRFHRGLARLILDFSRLFPDLPVVLGGGVFQNRMLVELLAEMWPSDGPSIALPGVIPVNDGGLSAGQLVIAGQCASERK